MILKKIIELRNEYYEMWGNVPTTLFINYKLYIQLRKELLYTPWGYHRIIYFKNTASILGMNIIIDMHYGMIVIRR